MKITGAKCLVDGLKDHGVKTIFGYPGTAILPVYYELKNSDIYHVLVRNEQSAVHAASGYARATGSTGVCIATSGPGATNMITGIATAYMDSIPIIAITGQVSSHMIGKDVFQEVDITGATEPFTKHNYLVKDACEIPRIIKEAFYIASTGRPGPVLIDIPSDIAKREVDINDINLEQNLRGYKPTISGHYGQIKRVVKAIQKSKRPVICVGGGAVSSNATENIKTLANKLDAPVASTLMGIGAFAASSNLFLGMIGQHGVYAANKAVNEADLLIVLGARMGDRAVDKDRSFSKDAVIVHIDIDPAEIGKNVNTHIPIVGDLNATLEKLLKFELKREDSDWIQRIKKWKDHKHETGFNLKGIDPKLVVQTLSDLSDDNSILVTDVGQHQIWSGRYYKVEKTRSFITSGGLGTMGYGLPASMGAKISSPEKDVILITGDGSFQMNLSELATLKQENASVKIIILNNGSLGMVREVEENRYKKQYYQVFIKGPDFIKLAEAYDIEAFRIEDKDDVEHGIRRLLEVKGPVIVEFLIDKNANVIPLDQEVK